MPFEPRQITLKDSRTVTLLRLELGVMPENSAGVRLYKGFGFVQEGVRPNRFKKESGGYFDELIMGRCVANPASHAEPTPFFRIKAVDQGSIIFIATGLGIAGATALTAWYLGRHHAKHSSVSTLYGPELLKACGPVTAQHAVTLAREALGEHTTPGLLRGITSGQDLNDKGESTRWCVIFETHNRQRTGVVSFSSSASMPGSALIVRIEILPAPPQPGEPLAEVFEDSPAALARLLSEGARVGSRATLSVRPNATGRTVWRLDIGGECFETPFNEAA